MHCAKKKKNKEEIRVCIKLKIHEMFKYFIYNKEG